MQQEKRRRVFGTGLSVKDGELIYLYRAIKSRVFHGTFLSLGLGQQLKCCEHHRNHLYHAGDLQASGPKGRTEKAYHTEPLLPRHLENDFQLDRGAERKACVER